MPYTHEDRKRLDALLRRAAFLYERTASTPRNYDVAELVALRWAIDKIVTAFGSLPEEHERARAKIWGERRQPT